MQTKGNLLLFTLKQIGIIRGGEIVSHRQFLEEKNKIDQLLQQGYYMKQVVENLSGAFVEFALKEPDSSGTKKPNETLHIQSADARKYFSVLIMQQITHK